MTTPQPKLFPTPLGKSYIYQLDLSLRHMKSIWLVGGVLGGLFIILLAATQFVTPDLAGNDGYYHIKLAQTMRLNGLRPPFPWLPLSVLNPDAFVDHHFLYHVLLIPFTYGDLRLGAKWASVILPALSFLSGWVLLRGQRVPYAALWAISFFAASEAFLYRMSMPRAQAASLLVLLLSLHVALTGRYRWLILLAFLYVWLYNAFPLILLLVGAYVAARWLLEGRLNVRPLLYTGIGLLLGLIINPYFPDNLLFIYQHLFPKLIDATAIRVGNEWYPYRTWTLVENSGPALAMFVLGTFALGLREKRMATATATLLFITVIFGLMLFKSRRFVEYYPAFALLFCALAWGPLVKDWTERSVWVSRLLPGGMSLLLAALIFGNVRGTQESLLKSKPYERYAEAATWLRENTPPGSLVFQTDWDDFTRLYFYNTHNVYLAGLDPTYMQLYDANLYDTWVDITKGRLDSPAKMIRDKFDAAYIFSDLNHKEFLRAAEDDPQIKEVYRDEYAVIFEIIN